MQKNLFCCLIKVIYLGSGYYPRTLTYLKDCRQSKDAANSKITKCTHFYQKAESGSHCHVLLLVNLYFYQLCKRQSADTNVLIDRYQLSAKWLIIGRYQLLADYQCIFKCNSTVVWFVVWKWLVAKIIAEMTYYVWSRRRTLNPTHSLTHWWWLCLIRSCCCRERRCL